MTSTSTSTLTLNLKLNLKPTLALTLTRTLTLMGLLWSGVGAARAQLPEPALVPSQVLRVQDHPGMPSMDDYPHTPTRAASSGDWLALGFPHALVEEGEDESMPSGRVLLWRRVAGLWQPRQVLRIPGPPQGGDEFGYRLLMDGPRLLVGSRNGPEQLHAYRLVKDAWVDDGRIVSPGLPADAVPVGLSLALAGDTLVVGCASLDMPPLGSGFVDVFQGRSTGGWAHVARLKDTGVLGGITPGNGFGRAVGISADMIFVTEEAPSGWLSIGPRIAVFKKAGATWVKSHQLRLPQLEAHPGEHLEIQTTGSHVRVGYRDQFVEFFPAQGSGVALTQGRGLPDDARGNTALWLNEDSSEGDLLDVHERMPDLRWRLEQTLTPAAHGVGRVDVVHLTPRELLLAGRTPDGTHQIRLFSRPQRSYEFEHSGLGVPLPAADGAATVTLLDAGTQAVLGREIKPLVTLTATQTGDAPGELGVTVTGDTADFSLSASSLLLAPQKKGSVKVNFKPLTPGEKHLFVSFVPKGQATTPTPTPTPVARYEIVVRVPAQGTPASELTFTRQPQSGLYGRSDFDGLHAEVSGSGPITYRWLKDGKPVPGATAPSFWPKEGGRYRLEATNSGGSYLSATAVLGFFHVAKPTLYTAPGATVRCAITLSGPADLLTVRWHDSSEQPLPPGLGFADVDKPVLTVKSAPAMGESITYFAIARLQLGEQVLRYGDTVTLHTRRAPVIQELGTTELRVGDPAYFVPVVDYPGDPATSSSVSFRGLPPGLTASSLDVSGTPTKAGVYSVQVTAKVDSYTVTKSFRVTVLPNGPVAGIYAGQMERTEAFPDLGELMLDVNTAGTYTGTLCVGTTRTAVTGTVAQTAGWRSPERPLPVKLGGLAYVWWFQALDTFDLEHPEYAVYLRRASFSLTSSQFHQIGTLRLLKAHSTSPDTAFTGGYNFGLLAPEPVGGGTLADPQGHGFGTLKVAANGRVTYTAQLADGSALTGATWIAPADLSLPVHQASTTTRSLLHGTASLGVASTLSWQRPAQPGRLYPGGITARSVDFLPARYQAVTGQPLLSGAPHELALSAYLTHPAPVPVTLTAQHSVQFGPGPANPLKATLTITRSTGLLSGQFTLVAPDPANPARSLTRLVPYRGILLQGIDRGVGYFHVPLPPDPQAQPPTKTTTSPIVSGSVLLRAVSLPN